MTSKTIGLEARTERVIRIFARGLNIVAAAWLLGIALVILFDVVGREAFDSPFFGTNEIVSNSVLSILFLQLPLSILDRTSLRTTIVYGQLRARGRGYVDALSYLLGAALFLVIVVGSWPNMIEAWEILEQEGSGVITIPVYPIRTLVVAVSMVGVAVCALLIYQALAHPRDYQDT